MRHRPGVPDPRQQAAFEHSDVIALVDYLVGEADPQLVSLADRFSLIRRLPDQDQLRAAIGDALYYSARGDAAVQTASLALAIGTAANGDDRRRRRGAMLERLTYEAVRARAPRNTHHEYEVELLRSPRSRRSWTNKKEIVVDLSEWEVYECKTDGLVDIADVDELSDVSTTATAEGMSALPVVVVFGDDARLHHISRAWRMTEVIYGVTTLAILDLRSRSPKHLPIPK